MSGAFVEVYGGSVVRPAQPSFLALTIDTDTQLVWPLETTGGTPVVAAMLNVTATIGSLFLHMPPGNTGSTGVQSMISNVGSNTFTVTTTDGVPITPIAAGEAWLIALIDNSSGAGSWTVVQMGAIPSAASAAALAGPGLVAIGSELSPNAVVTLYTSNHTLVAADRFAMSVWNGSVDGIFQLALTSALVPQGWLSFVRNETAATDLTIQPSGGETIDGLGQLVLAPGEGAVIFSTSGQFFSIRGVTTPLPITSGGTGDTSAGGARTNLGGTAIGQSIFTAPSAASVRALLGLTNLTFTEYTISTNQSLNSGSANSAFVCTGALVATLPLTTDLTTSFLVAFYAQSGIVTLRPQATDKINNGSAGADYLIPEGGSLMLFTDANGNWWPFFVAGGAGVFSTLHVLGAATVGGDMTIAGAATVGAGVDIFGGGLSVNGGSVLSDGVTASGGASVVGGVVIDTLNTSGAATVGGALKVGGASTLAGAVSIGAAATVNGVLHILTGGTTPDEAINFGQFAFTGGNPFNAVIPAGAILKAGNGTSGVSGNVTITFATSFPTACDGGVAVLTGATPVTNGWSVGRTAKSASDISFVTGQAGVGTSGMTFDWWAWGH